MRENSVRDVLFSQFTLSRNNIALDQLGDFCTHHVRAQQFTRLLVEDGFHEAIRRAEGDSFAITDERETADFDVIALFLRRLLGEPDTGDLRVGVSTAWNIPRVELLAVAFAGDARAA